MILKKAQVKLWSFLIEEKRNKRLLTNMNKTGTSEKSNASIGWLSLLTSSLDSHKGHVKIIFLPVICLSFPFFCPKLEQALHKQQEQHSWHAGNIFFWKRCIEIPKNAILCVRVVFDQLCNANGPRAQVQRDELVARLSFGETAEFLQAEVFVFWETLMQLV